MTPTLNDMLNALSDTLHQRDLSPVTISAYLSDARFFAEWWAAQANRPFDPRAVVGGDVRRYREHMQRLGFQAATINRRLLGVRVWFGVLKLSLDLPHNPASGVGLMEETPLGPRWLDRAERLALQREMERHWLAAQARPHSAQAIWQMRDVALLSVLYHTGLRVTEVAHLDVTHLELNARSGWLTVHGKGRKQRRVPLNAEARARLTDWLARRPACDSPAVFVSTQRRRMVTRSIERVVEDCGQRAGIHHLTPHRLRHTFAKHLVTSGATLDEVATLLGHTNLNTTRIYITPDSHDLEQVVDKMLTA